MSSDGSFVSSHNAKAQVIFTTDSDKVVDAYYSGPQVCARTCVFACVRVGPQHVQVSKGNVLKCQRKEPLEMALRAGGGAVARERECWRAKRVVL